MSAAVSNVPAPQAGALARRELERTDFEVAESVLARDVIYACQGIDSKYLRFSKHSLGGFEVDSQAGISAVERQVLLVLSEIGWLFKHIQAHASSCSESGVAGGTIRQSFCSALQAELSEFYHLMAVLQEQSLREAPKPDNLSSGQTGAGYLTLRRLIVWLAEPKIRMRGLAGIADAVAQLEGGALINAVGALAQHGDSLVQQFISRTLQQMCQPLFQMAREWVFDGRLNNAGTEFFVGSTGLSDDLWRNGYRLNEEMRPSFISKQMAGTILRAGKSINFLRQCSMQDSVAFDQHSRENAVGFELYQQGANTQELEQLQLQCMAAVLPHLTGYIWQQDAFTLHSSKAATPPWNKPSVTTARSGDSSSASEHLWGLVRFGDNIEDEWLIVWLLHQITIKFSGVCARIWDNDGDFLLIEAAYSLPKWLKPETSKNRVWLLNGQLHVIPLPNRHYPTLPSSPTIQEALQILSSESVNTIAKAGVQEAIRLKIKGYPRKAQADMHRSRCLLPAKIAHVLQHKPQLVSPAVQTFHYRDVQDMRAAAKLAHFQPQDLVTVIVSFNRALYAQLAQQQFQPPRGYPLLGPNHPAFKAADLGMKLTCGFEMVMAKHTSETSSGTSSTFQGSVQLDASALKGNPQWVAFKASLAKNGYFRGNIPGSAQYKEMLAEAVQAFGQSEAYQQSANATAGPGEAIAAILQQPIDRDQFQDGPEDDDSWMTGGAADLEAELAQRQKELEGDVTKRAKRTAQELDPTEAAPEFDPSEMVSKLNAFVNQTSGHEGAEVPSDMDPDVSFDDPAFWRELKSALGVAADKHGIHLDQLSDSGSSSDGFGEEEEDDDDNVSSSSEEVTDDMSHSDDGVSQHTHARAGRTAQPHTQTSLAQGKPAVPQRQHPAAADSQQHMPAPASGTAHDAEAAANDAPDDSASDVMTATDSDDEDASFMHAYDQALADELSGSRVGSIIMPDASAGANTDQPEHNTAAAAAATSSDQAADLQPLDLDTNLVRNLLQSYTAQQGLAGPAGNLAGLLGLNLPDHAEAD